MTAVLPPAECAALLDVLAWEYRNSSDLADAVYCTWSSPFLVHSTSTLGDVRAEMRRAGEATG